MSLNENENLDVNINIKTESEEDVDYVEDVNSKNNKNIIKKIKIDYTKTDFTEEEKMAIRNEVAVIKQQYPNYVPIIVRTNKKDKDLKLTKTKFLVTSEITLAQFLVILRKKISAINSTESIFLLINDTLSPVTLTLASIYHEKRDLDTNMLFITVCKENTFG